MTRLSFVSLRIVIALAVILAGARFLMPVNAVEAASPSPETLRTGDLGDSWRYIETVGRTGVPYYHTEGGQGRRSVCVGARRKAPALLHRPYFNEPLSCSIDLGS